MYWNSCDIVDSKEAKFYSSRRLALPEPAKVGEMDDISHDDKDNDLFTIDIKGNTCYSMMSYNTQRITALVVQPCDSLDTCLHPVGRPLGLNETVNVVCVTDCSSALLLRWKIPLTQPHPSDLSLPFWPLPTCGHQCFLHATEAHDYFCAFHKYLIKPFI